MSTLFTEFGGSGDSAIAVSLSLAAKAATDSFVNRTPIVPVPAPVESLQAATPNTIAVENAVAAKRVDLNINASFIGETQGTPWRSTPTQCLEEWLAVRSTAVTARYANV